MKRLQLHGEKVTDFDKYNINKIHLFKKQSSDNPTSPSDNLGGIYDEWIIVEVGGEYVWEQLGPAKIDLRAYTLIDTIDDPAITRSEWESGDSFIKSFNTVTDANNVTVLEITEISNGVETQFIPNSIAYNDGEIIIDATATDIFGAVSFALTEGAKLRIKYTYNFD